MNTDQPSMRVLSLGAGVQSSTLLLMACAGDLPRLDQVDWRDDDQLDLWPNECLGMCGV